MDEHSSGSLCPTYRRMQDVMSVCDVNGKKKEIRGMDTPWNERNTDKRLDNNIIFNFKRTKQ